MFQPASLKGDSPTPIDERIRKKFLLLYILIIILSLIPVSLFEYWYITLFWSETNFWIFFIALPFNVFLSIYLLQLSAILVSVLILKIINLIHTPKEGYFKRSIEDRDYYFWTVRNIVKKWPLYVTSSNPFPWLKNRFTLRFYGVKIGRNTICDNSWISSEFVSIGKNVIVNDARNFCVFSFFLYIIRDNPSFIKK